MILEAALAAGAAAILAPEAWSFIKRKWPARADLFRSRAAMAEALAKPLVLEAETKLKEAAMAATAEAEALKSKLGAKISALTTRAEAAEKSLADKQAEVDAAAQIKTDLEAAHTNVSNLTTQVDELKGQLQQAQADLAAEKQAHADDLNDIATLAPDAPADPAAAAA